MTAEVLSVEGVTAGYGGILALRGVSLHVNEGAFVCVIGSNGAGKSTLMNCISGIVKTRSGHIHLRGKEISGEAADRIARRRLLQVPEGRRVLVPMSVEDNLLVSTSPAGLKSKSEAKALHAVYDLFPILGERRTQIAGSLSGGEQQMLAIGRALMGDPDVLLLDEPSLGLAPVIVSQVYESLIKLKNRGLTILLVEQNARLALKVSDYGYVLQRGLVAAEGASDALLEDASVAEAYLGGETSR